MSVKAYGGLRESLSHKTEVLHILSPHRLLNKKGSYIWFVNMEIVATDS